MVPGLGGSYFNSCWKGHFDMGVDNSSSASGFCILSEAIREVDLEALVKMFGGWSSAAAPGWELVGGAVGSNVASGVGPWPVESVIRDQYRMRIASVGGSFGFDYRRSCLQHWIRGRQVWLTNGISFAFQFGNLCLCCFTSIFGFGNRHNASWGQLLSKWHCPCNNN